MALTGSGVGRAVYSPAISNKYLPFYLKSLLISREPYTVMDMVSHVLFGN